jgi:hypothetical protein
MADEKLTDNEIDNRLKSAQLVLGDEPGQSIEGDTAISAARQALHLLSLGLIAATVKRGS